MKFKAIIICYSVIFISIATGKTFAQSQSSMQPKVDSTQRLSQAQLLTIKTIQTESEKKATPAALQLAQTAKQIYENMLADQENPALRQELMAKLNAATTELLTIKGQSMREMVGVLTPEQKQLVRQAMQQPDASGDLGDLIKKVFNVDKF